MYRTAASTEHVFLPFVMDILQENTKIYSFIHIGRHCFFSEMTTFPAYFLETEIKYAKKTPYGKHILGLSYSVLIYNTI